MKRIAIPSIAVILITALPAACQIVASGDGVTLVSQSIKASLDGRRTGVTIDFVLENGSDGETEGTVLIPLPQGSAVSSFTMGTGDARLEPELLDREEARQVYDRIVSARKDPAILEIVGHGAVRARVYPIPPKGRVSLSLVYGHATVLEGGMIRFRVPAFRSGGGILAELSLEIDLDDPLGAIYSPSHLVEVVRDGDRRAKVHYRQDIGSHLPVFTVYLVPATKGIGATLATYKEKGEKGHGLLFISPDLDAPSLPRDVIFVLDRSGSMQGEKFEQATEALCQSIRRLGSRDAFSIVDFASDVDWTELRPSSAFTRGQGVEHVRGLSAGGGTQLGAALEKALGLVRGREGRVAALFVVTDGLPDGGSEAVLERVRKLDRNGVRIFTFAVGGNADIRLLDRLAKENGGIGDVVRPGERIDERTLAIFEKVQAPVLTDVELQVEGVELRDLYPRTCPDLFEGGRIVLAVRYSGSGPASLRLTGMTPEGPVELTCHLEFPEENRDDFEIARLWARRKVAFLLDRVRLEHVEEKEVIEEIMNLSTEYRVMTPFTAFLITEPEIDLSSARERLMEELGLIRHRADTGAPRSTLDRERALDDSRLNQALGG